MTFRVAPGARLRKADADVVGRELMRLRKTGPLTKERLVVEAGRRGSPLRRFFEWSDRKAAQQYRIEQAGYLLRSIEIVVEDAKGKQVAIKGFYNVTSAEGRRWEPMQFAFDDAGLSEQILKDAYAQLEGWIERFKKYEWARDSIPQVMRALGSIRKSSIRKSSIGRSMTGRGRRR
jgi:hypothetical protein